MTNNFQLKWRMTIEFPDGKSENIVIGYPLTVEFNINRSGKADDQSATFKVYNLNKSTRRLLFKDITADNETPHMPKIYFEAGYNDMFSLIYRGNILECNSFRDSGSTEVITSFTCFDLNILKYVGKTYSANTPIKDIIRDVASILELNEGTIGDFQKVVKGNYTISGNAIDALETLTGGCTYVDNGILHVLAPNECVDVESFKFNSDNIYGTPRRSNAFITFTTKMLPSVTLFQSIELESRIQPENNGTMKVYDIKHTGTISGGVPCSAQTTLTCWYGLQNRELPLNTTVNTDKRGQSPKQTNTSPTNYRDNFVAIKNGEPVFLNSKNPTSLLQVYRDINNKGVKAKVLSEKALGRILWHEIIDYPNLKGSQRPTYKQISDLYNTLTVLLTFIRSRIGNVSIYPSSGWRSIANNRAIGGVSDSRHLKGLAIDFSFSNPELTKRYALIFLKHWNYGWTGYYPNKNFIHIQIGGNKPDRR